ncbi:hypothetical protein AB1Y20_006450 [Prymnesium parvum]|uniref:Transmembrane protein 66 n=1 Tax=Prymnesium parvum TaxID=97485 RepID=A0AB34IXS7_PRYPA
MVGGRAALLSLAALLLALSHASALQTPCERCCAPGGDCSRAYKGSAGKCCGTLEGRAYCCPSFSHPAADAMCHHCGGASYRCSVGGSSRGVCAHHRAAGGEWTRVEHRAPPPRADGRASEGLLVLAAVALFLALLFAFRRQHDVEPDLYASPMAKGAHPMYQMGAPPYAAGYSGMAVAGSAAAGFMGGMLVSEALDAGRHHHHDYASHHDFGGMSDDCGSFDGGGGDFAADS